MTTASNDVGPEVDRHFQLASLQHKEPRNRPRKTIMVESAAHYDARQRALARPGVYPMGSTAPGLHRVKAYPVSRHHNQAAGRRSSDDSEIYATAPARAYAGMGAQRSVRIPSQRDLFMHALGEMV